MPQPADHLAQRLRARHRPRRESELDRADGGDGREIEQRIGAPRFGLLYLTALLGGSLGALIQTTQSVTVGGLVLNGVASLRLAGRSLLISQPDSGRLFTEYSRAGVPMRSIGELRKTGFEDDFLLHTALNAGLALADPAGGYYFVFLTGRPMFRKYDAAGTLVFERHIEGTELDAFVEALPNRWPTRRVDDREIPYVAPTIRTAAVDAQSRLWISLTLPYTYVYDAHGDKVRTVQFSSTGIFAPTSLAFSPSGRVLVTPGCYEFDPS